ADGSWPTYRQPEVTVDDVSVFEQSTGMRYNSGSALGATYAPTQSVPRISQRFSASYVTGTHAFKTGIQLEQTYIRIGAELGTRNVDYIFSGGSPVSLNQWATPYEQK